MADSYFGHHAISNSDLTRLHQLVDPNYEEPANLDEIFALGTLNHLALLEPHKAKIFVEEKIAETDDIVRIGQWHKDLDLANAMAKTVLNDPFCRMIIMARDFRREFEWYEDNLMGFDHVRCKTDGDSRIADVVFEYKGLSLTNETAFDAAIERLNYDRAAAWYLNITKLKRWFIVGVSKKNPKLIFKRVVDRNHKWYISGSAKIEKSKEEFRQYIGQVS